MESIQCTACGASNPATAANAPSQEPAARGTCEACGATLNLEERAVVNESAGDGSPVGEEGAGAGAEAEAEAEEPQAPGPAATEATEATNPETAAEPTAAAGAAEPVAEAVAAAEPEPTAIADPAAPATAADDDKAIASSTTADANPAVAAATAADDDEAAPAAADTDTDTDPAAAAATATATATAADANPAAPAAADPEPTAAAEPVDPLLAAALNAYSGAARPVVRPSVPDEKSEPLAQPSSRANEAPAGSREQVTTDAPVVTPGYDAVLPKLPVNSPNALFAGAAGLLLVLSFFVGRITAPSAASAEPQCPPASDASPAESPKTNARNAATPPTPGPSASMLAAAPELSATPKRTPALRSAFDAKAAGRALKQAAARASSCRRAGDPHGAAVVMVTFANSGYAASANVTGAPYAGTPTATCISSLLKNARVPAFAGEAVTVKKTLAL